eukprot:GFUD01010648.1.p1 GENE.GFUD01010648.1~~GFUD01010648.1.p1  ORF type:complete len:926 (+),score=262.27 GFUD01010648.1:182-2959(+)
MSGGSISNTLPHYGATVPFRRLASDSSSNDMSQLVHGERRLFRSLAGAPESDQLALLDDEKGVRTLGTVKGVFAPVSLSMFSALLFLRVGYIVGNAGFLEAVLLFMIAYVILVSTVFSICAIATNGAVKTGGVYFMLSRTMGPEIGGAVGVLFYFANVVCCALYVTACVEGLLNSFGEDKGAFIPDGGWGLPTGRWWNFLYCSGFNLANLCLCLVGAELFGKFSLGILSLVSVCCVGVVSSFFLDHSYTIPFNITINENTTQVVNGTFTGLSHSNLSSISALWSANLYPNYLQDCQDQNAKVDFFTVFGVLFSGVTGIMAGANMSGDLISPGKSIPRGTLSACFFTFVTFMVLILLTALTCDTALLHNDCMYMVEFTFWKPFVLVGVILATWSASLSNMIGASRVLQAVAEDTMFGPFLTFINKGTVKNNPITAVIATFCWVELAFLIGGLNQIAQLCSVLFLLSYASVNLACLGLDLASAPNFRPTFKYFSWHTSLVGMVGTSTMMFFISPLFAAVSILLCLSLILALNFFSPARNANWGSISQALIFHQVRKYLLLLDPRKSHIKFWRPQMLLLVHNPRSCCSLVDFVNGMKKGGLYVLGQVTVGSLADNATDPLAEKTVEWLSLIDHLKVKAFVELTLADSVRKGVEQLVRVSGIGAMKPNTILLGFHDDTSHLDDLSSPGSPFHSDKFAGVLEVDQQPRLSAEDYVGIIQDTLKLHKNVGLCRNFQMLDRTEVFSSEMKFRVRAGRKKYLDVWPVNFFTSMETDVADNTSLFLFQLACIVSMVPKWKKHTLRVFMCARATDSNMASKEKELQQLLEVLRIKAKTFVLVWDHLACMMEDGVGVEGGRVMDQYSEVSEEYLLAANEFIRVKCTETAVSFIYLPRPPCNTKQHPAYLSMLELLTRGLPPTILVNGVSPVITTTL